MTIDQYQEMSFSELQRKTLVRTEMLNNIVKLFNESIDRCEVDREAACIDECEKTLAKVNGALGELLRRRKKFMAEQFNPTKKARSPEEMPEVIEPSEIPIFFIDLSGD